MYPTCVSVELMQMLMQGRFVEARVGAGMTEAGEGTQLGQHKNPTVPSRCALWQPQMLCE